MRHSLLVSLILGFCASEKVNMCVLFEGFVHTFIHTNQINPEPASWDTDVIEINEKNLGEGTHIKI